MNDFESLYSHLKSLCSLSRVDFEAMIPNLKRETLEKNTYLFQEGESYQKIAFIVQGLVKKFYLTSDGKEFIKEFSCENEIIAPYSSLLQNHAASFSIKTLEDTVLLSIKWDKVKEMFTQNIQWMECGKNIAEIHFINREQRELEFLKYSALERYKAFQKRYPHLQSRLKRQDIASYLGVTPVSLSRMLNH